MEFQRKENKSKKKLKLVSVPLRGYRIPNNPASFIASSKDIKFPSPDGAIEFQMALGNVEIRQVNRSFPSPDGAIEFQILKLSTLST